MMKVTFDAHVCFLFGLESFLVNSSIWAEKYMTIFACDKNF